MLSYENEGKKYWVVVKKGVNRLNQSQKGGKSTEHTYTGPYNESMFLYGGW